MTINPVFATCLLTILFITDRNIFTQCLAHNRNSDYLFKLTTILISCFVSDLLHSFFWVFSLEHKQTMSAHSPAAGPHQSEHCCHALLLRVLEFPLSCLRDRHEWAWAICRVLGASTPCALPCVPALGHGLTQSRGQWWFASLFLIWSFWLRFILKTRFGKSKNDWPSGQNPAPFAFLIKALAIWTCRPILYTPSQGQYPAVHRLIQLPTCAQAVPSLWNSLPCPFLLDSRYNASTTSLKPPRPSQAVWSSSLGLSLFS